MQMKDENSKQSQSLEQLNKTLSAMQQEQKGKEKTLSDMAKSLDSSRKLNRYLLTGLVGVIIFVVIALIVFK